MSALRSGCGSNTDKDAELIWRTRRLRRSMSVDTQLCSTFTTSIYEWSRFIIIDKV